jgi:hypothetical protein
METNSCGSLVSSVSKIAVLSLCGKGTECQNRAYLIQLSHLRYFNKRKKSIFSSPHYFLTTKLLVSFFHRSKCNTLDLSLLCAITEDRNIIISGQCSKSKVCANEQLCRPDNAMDQGYGSRSHLLEPCYLT